MDEGRPKNSWFGYFVHNFTFGVMLCIIDCFWQWCSSVVVRVWWVGCICEFNSSTWYGVIVKICHRGKAVLQIWAWTSESREFCIEISGWNYFVAKGYFRSTLVIISGWEDLISKKKKLGRNSMFHKDKYK